MTKKLTLFGRVKKIAARLLRSDLVQRALHTAWQAAAASLVASFAGAGLSLGDLADLSVDQRIVTAAALAGLGAAFSLLKGAAKSRTTS